MINDSEKENKNPITFIPQLYKIVNIDLVMSFIKNHPYLIEILLEAPAHIHRIFGQVPIRLELHTDPEDGWDELFIIIKFSCSPEEALELDDKLAKEWFLDKMDKTKGNLNIAIEPLT